MKSGTLPAGLQLSAPTGVISGTPTAAGNFMFSAQVLDAKSATSSAGFSLSVASPGAPTITGLSPNSGTTQGGTPVTISGTNFHSGAGVQFGATLAASVQLVSSTQLRAVTPPEPSGVVNVTVLDGGGQTATASNAFTFVPQASPLQIASTPLPTGAVGIGYSTNLVATGGVPPYSWSKTGGTLPSGLQLNPASGALAGTPTAAGTFSFTAKVSDAKSATSTAGLSVNVSPAGSPTISGVVPEMGPTAGGTRVTVSGTNFRTGDGVQFGSRLATSVQLVSATQLEAVTPSESSGIVDVTVQDASGQVARAHNAFDFVAPLKITTAGLVAGSVGVNYSSGLAATGGMPPYSWSTAGGALPGGLQLNSSNGTITGVPTAVGSFPFTAKVLDASQASSSSSFTLAISSNSSPTILGVSPNSGPSAGGTLVTITGTNFRTGAEVQFGGNLASSVQVVNATQIQAVTPAESSGSVDVIVQNSDGLTATATDAFAFNNPGSNTPPVVPAPSSDPLAPKIFHFSSSAQAGDTIFVQGANFDASSQVWLGGATAATATQLTVINRTGAIWLSAKIPQSWSGALVLWISNSHGASKAVALNGAVPTHLDALQLVPRGAFRVMGRNLLVAGATPVVTVDGQPAILNLGASDENTLVAAAPASISPTSASVVKVDNGNGTGPVLLDRQISVVAGSGDPFGLGVGWGAGFTFAGQVVRVSTPCNGVQDDTDKIQAAINSAASLGGTVKLPGGTCRLTGTLDMKSNVVLQGAGKDVTILKYEGNYPVSAKGVDLVGVEDVTFLNSGSAIEGPIWQQNSRSFLLRVKIDMGVSHQLFLTENSNFVVAQCDFIQRGSIGGQNPYLFNGSEGMLFTGNTTTSIDGSPTFRSVHDSLFIGNHFTRDASHQNQSTVIATHRFVMDFAYRIAVVGNTFDISNGPVTNKTRNDGETLLTEGGGQNRTENLGTVSSATANTITDTNNAINVNPFGNGLPENYGMAIVSGKGAGQMREIVSYSNGTIQVDHPWEVVPDSTSHYATFVWGLEKSLLKGNTLVDNPRGIWLYQTAIRDVDVVGNTITNGGGIYLRTFQSTAAKQFDPIYDVRIRDNKLSNSTGRWMSYINVVFVNKDQTNFGIADIGIEMGNNTLTANVPNLISMTEEYAGREGYMNVMRSETSGGQLTSTPMVLGTILQGNHCNSCSTPFIIGTGDYGTMLMNNTPPPSSSNSISDWKTLGSSISGSVGTVAQ